MVSYTKDFFK